MGPVPESNEPNVWTAAQAAQWAGLDVRQLHDLFADGVLPAIPVGHPHTQKLPGKLTRHRRTNRWAVPRIAFIAAWQTFKGTPLKKRRTA